MVRIGRTSAPQTLVRKLASLDCDSQYLRASYTNQGLISAKTYIDIPENGLFNIHFTRCVYYEAD